MRRFARMLLIVAPFVLILLYAANSVPGAIPQLHHDVLFSNGPTVDARSAEALNRSIFAMAEALHESEQQAFSDIVYFVLWQGVDHAKGEKPDPLAQFKPWQGYTAARLVARHREAYAAHLAELDARDERQAEEAHIANVNRGREEVRRLKAEIAREPEILAMLEKVEIRSLQYKWNERLIGTPHGQPQGLWSYWVDVDFVINNRTNFDLGLVTIVFELSKDGSQAEREVVTFDFGEIEDDVFYSGEIVAEADPIPPGTTRKEKASRIFLIDTVSGRAGLNAGDLNRNTRLSARVIAIVDAAGRNEISTGQIGEARRHLRAWEEFFAKEN